jgi:hypothetical protein
MAAPTSVALLSAAVGVALGALVGGRASEREYLRALANVIRRWMPAIASRRETFVRPGDTEIA